ncbi:MAG: DUF86 domain-containing protein [Candidatus Sericytochromatia bacterium]|nr:DUF86 domain-containing protein [Candidatus Sericytochromatia bacterium]
MSGASTPRSRGKGLTGIRSKIVHDYLDVDFDVLWDVVTVDLGPLIDALKQIITDEPGSP